MNMDFIITAAAIAMAYCGYRIGFEAGKVEGRKDLRKAERALEAERRIATARDYAAIKAWDSK